MGKQHVVRKVMMSTKSKVCPDGLEHRIDKIEQ